MIKKKIENEPAYIMQIHADKYFKKLDQNKGEIVNADKLFSYYKGTKKDKYVKNDTLYMSTMPDSLELRYLRSKFKKEFYTFKKLSGKESSKTDCIVDVLFDNAYKTDHAELKEFYYDEETENYSDSRPVQVVQKKKLEMRTEMYINGFDLAVNGVKRHYVFYQRASAVPDGVIADRLDAAGYALANTLDADGAAELVSGGTAFGTTTALTKSTIYETFVDAMTAQTKAGVPLDNQRYAIVNPDVYALLLKSPEFIEASNLSDQIKQTGAIGAIAGFNIYQSTNLGVNVEAVCGHPLYATRIKEFSVLPHVQSLDGSGKYIGASAVQGHYVYGHKVTDTAAVLVKKSAAA